MHKNLSVTRINANAGGVTPKGMPEPRQNVNQAKHSNRVEKTNRTVKPGSIPGRFAMQYCRKLAVTAKKRTIMETIANEILMQLGGNKFLMMTGAKNLCFDEKTKSINFKIMRNSFKVTHVKIELTVFDTYTMTFFNCGKELKIIKTVNGVYNDMLQSVFTANTGLYTFL